MAILEETLGPEHPETASLLVPFAESLTAAGRPHEALLALQRAESMLQARPDKAPFKAEAALAHAEALWPIGADRPEAIRRAEVALALVAAEDLQGDAPRWRAEAEQWLATHHLPSKPGE